jgi:hypothetical protein
MPANTPNPDQPKPPSRPRSPLEPRKTARHLGVSGLSAKGGIVDLGPLARASSSCSGTSFGLTPGPEGGVNVDLGAFHFTFMPLCALTQESPDLLMEIPQGLPPLSRS